MKQIETKIKTGKTISFKEKAPVNSNVVDFIELVKKSIQEKKQRIPEKRKTTTRKTSASNKVIRFKFKKNTTKN